MCWSQFASSILLSLIWKHIRSFLRVEYYGRDHEDKSQAMDFSFVVLKLVFRVKNFKKPKNTWSQLSELKGAEKTSPGGRIVSARENKLTVFARNTTLLIVCGKMFFSCQAKFQSINGMIYNELKTSKKTMDRAKNREYRQRSAFQGLMLSLKKMGR